MSTAPEFRQRLFRSRPEDTLPLTIEHQRIYILPTARGCAFVAALLLMLVASVNYDLSLGYALCFLLTGLFTSTLLHTYRNMAGLRLVSITADSCFSGEHAPFHALLDSPQGRIRHGIRIQATTKVRADVTVQTVDQDAAGSAELKIPAERRGRLKLGRLTLSSTWPLGLWRSWSYVHCPAAATIWPAPESDPPPLPVTGGDDEGEGAGQPDTEGDVSGLRDWLPGDPPSRIAWKRMARGDEPKVRLLDADTRPGITELALESTRLSAIEAQLSRLSAWILNADQLGVDYALTLPEHCIDAGHGGAHRTSSLDALATHGLGSA